MQNKPYYRGEKDTKKVCTWKEKFQSSSDKWKSFHLQQSALLIVDMQKYFLNENSHAFVPTGRTILPNISTLIQLFRGAGRPVIFTYFAVKKGEDDPIEHWWGDSVEEGSPESQLTEELSPLADELVIRKRTYSSFQGTVLDEYLKSKNVRSLVVTGVLTNLCCEMAVREAFCLGFDVFVSLDATATYSEKVHLSSLDNMSYGFATPISLQEILQSPL